MSSVQFPRYTLFADYLFIISAIPDRDPFGVGQFVLRCRLSHYMHDDGLRHTLTIHETDFGDLQWSPLDFLVAVWGDPVRLAHSVHLRCTARCQIRGHRKTSQCMRASTGTVRRLRLGQAEEVTGSGVICLIPKNAGNFHSS